MMQDKSDWYHCLIKLGSSQKRRREKKKPYCIIICHSSWTTLDGVLHHLDFWQPHFWSRPEVHHTPWAEPAAAPRMSSRWKIPWRRGSYSAEKALNLVCEPAALDAPLARRAVTNPPSQRESQLWLAMIILGLTRDRKPQGGAFLFISRFPVSGGGPSLDPITSKINHPF